MEKKILITGAGGYIGSVSTAIVLKHGYEVVALDNFSTGYSEPLVMLQKEFGTDKLRYYHADLLADYTDIFAKEQNIQGVINYAGNCSVDESMHNPSKYFTNNAFGLLSLLKALSAQHIDKIVFSSTCAVYGQAQYNPVDEKHPLNPINPYGESKKMAEHFLDWFDQIYHIRSVALRYFNVCGATDDGSIGDAKKPSVHLIQNLVRAVMGIEPFSLTCPEVATPDKTPIRDYVNVVDLAMAHLKALEYLFANGKNEVINIGTGKGNSVKEIIQTVEEETGKTITVNKGKVRRGEYATMVASYDKAKQILSWEPKHTLKDSIHSLVLWYKNHPDGWSK